MYKKKLGLVAKLNITFVVSMVLIAGVVLVFLNSIVTDRLFGLKKESVSIAVKQQSEEIRLDFDDVRLGGRNLAKNNLVTSYFDGKVVTQDPKILNLFSSFQLSSKYEAIYLMDTKGTTLVSTDPSFLEKDFGFRSYFKEALAGKEDVDALVGSVSKKLGYYFSFPVYGSQNSVVGVLVLKLSPSLVSDTLQHHDNNAFGKYMVVDRFGVVITGTKDGVEFSSLGKLNADELKQINEEKRYADVKLDEMKYERLMAGVRTKSSYQLIRMFDIEDNIDELLGFSKIGDYPFYLVSEVETAKMFADISRITGTLALIMLALVVLAVGVRVFEMNRVLSPLGQLEIYAKRVAEGEDVEHVVVKTGDELESLSLSIGKMVSSLKGFYTGLEEKVAEKTSELKMALDQMARNNAELQESRTAMLNLMEDVGVEKDNITKEKNKLEAILGSIGDGVFVTDSKGKVTLMNSAAQKMTGHTLFDAVNKDYKKIFNFAFEEEKGEYPDFVKQVLSTGRVTSLTRKTVLLGKNGKGLPVLDSAAPIRDIHGNVVGCVVVFRDNTKERELEKSKDEFLSVASHQLRTPLGSMRWNAEMLLEGDAGEISEEAKEVAANILEGNMRMIALVNDLLDVSRIEQGRVLDEPEEVDVREVVKETVKEVGVEAKKRNEKITMTFSKELPKLFVDKKRVREMVENLVSNAVKYNKNGGKVAVKLVKKLNNMVLSVKDEGIGMTEKDLRNIFNKFYRGEVALKSETEGTGLGLYVVRQYVEGWGGNVKVKSEPGKGSEFLVTLPLKIDNKSKIKKS